MATPYRPTGYPTVSPYLIVAGAAGTLEFLTRVFGGEELRRIQKDGRIMHAEIRLDDSVVMLADSAPGWPTMEAHVHVYVPDVDATCAKALAAGASAVQAPIRKDDDDKRGGVKDAGGTTWSIGTKVA